MAEDLNINIRGGQGDMNQQSIDRLSQRIQSLDQTLSRQNQQVQGSLSRSGANAVGRVQRQTGGFGQGLAEGAGEGIGDNVVQGVGTAAVTGGVFAARQGGIRPAIRTVGNRVNQVRRFIGAGRVASRGLRSVVGGAGSFATPFAALSGAGLASQAVRNFSLPDIVGGLQAAGRFAREQALFGQTEQGTELGFLGPTLRGANLASVAVGGPDFVGSIDQSNQGFRQVRQQRQSQLAAEPIRNRLRQTENATEALGASPAEQFQQRLQNVDERRLLTIRQINKARSEGNITQQTQNRLIERANEAFDEQRQKIAQVRREQQQQLAQQQRQQEVAQRSQFRESTRTRLDQQNERLGFQRALIGAEPIEQARLQRGRALDQAREQFQSSLQQARERLGVPDSVALETISPQIASVLPQRLDQQQAIANRRF